MVARGGPVVAGKTMDQFLTFRTRDGADTAEWSHTADVLQHRLAAALEARGFEIDWELGRHEPDWCFAAGRGRAECMVVLVLAGLSPCHWWIGLENLEHSPLENEGLRSAIHPLLEATVTGYPGVSHLSWHPDASTLGEL